MCTVKLDCALPGGRHRSGTAFFFRDETAGSEPITVLITNAHVVENATRASFHVCAGDERGNPVAGYHHKITVEDVGSSVVAHPDGQIDLCAITLTRMHAIATSESMRLCYREIPSEQAISKEDLALAGPIEEVIVVGYPVGMWDSVNNRPVVRRGVTATPLDVDFDGRPEFLIDAASFEGSSGSPVFRSQSPFAQTSPDNFELLTSPRLRFAGVLARGEEHHRSAELTNVFATSGEGAQAHVGIPLHLGYVLKASLLAPLVEHARRQSG